MKRVFILAILVFIALTLLVNETAATPIISITRTPTPEPGQTFTPWPTATVGSQEATDTPVPPATPTLMAYPGPYPGPETGPAVPNQPERKHRRKGS